MGDQKEGVPEQPTPTAMIERTRQSHRRKRETPRLSAKTKQRP
jgi:hypothetical protein